MMERVVSPNGFCMSVPLNTSWEPHERPTVLRNMQCAYCGCSLLGQKITADHVIARNLVPKGSFEANDWNLILNSCDPCNNKKSALENEISALTLQPAVGDRHVDSALGELALRKAAVVRSRATGRLVKDSDVSHQIDVRLGSDITLSFGFAASPQLAPASVIGLVNYHLQAFFYLITYDDSNRTGSQRPRIQWWDFTRRSDWGSQLLTSFADETRGWLPRIWAYAGKGNYRIAMKRKDAATDLWSFAVELNRTLRVVGTFGDESESERFVETLTFDRMNDLRAGEAFREEVPLHRSEDDLFECIPL